MAKPSIRTKLSTLLGYLGPGFLVTVGFIDPGNWATNIEGGARYGYELLWVVTLGTLMLIVIQHSAARLGIATGKSLSVNIRENFSKPMSTFTGITVILACVATDVAELLGGGIGFSLLFNIPLWAGSLLTLLIKLFLIISQRYHRLESIIVGTLAIITLCYLLELWLVKPDWKAVGTALIIPRITPGTIATIMAILGALVMPHNIFLHSSAIRSRQWGITDSEKQQLLRYEYLDTTLAMTLGWLVNGSMIIVAAAVFFSNARPVTTLEEASITLQPIAGSFANLLFTLALICSGIGASLTSSMAEAEVITGFLGKPQDPGTPFYRASILIPSIPAFIIILLSNNTFDLLIISQLLLGIQLPFTLIPLLLLSRNSNVMGNFRSRTPEFLLACIIAATVTGLNLYFFTATISELHP